MFSKLFTMIFGGNSASGEEAKRYNTLSPAPRPPAQEPKFLLLETAEEYRRKLTEIATEAASLRQEVSEKRRQANELLDAAGSPAQRELNRRAAEKLGYEAGNLEYSIRSKGEETPAEVERELRRNEAQKIAHQGDILSQTWDESGAAKSGASFGSSFPHKTERRLVRFDGRVFLVQLEWNARTTKVAHSSGGSYGGAWTEYVPTGEFQPPTVSWATDSVAQMTEQELRTIA